MVQGKDREPEEVSPQDAEAREIDAVLALASDPPLPGDAMARLLARIAAEPQEAKVIAFAMRPRAARGFWRYAAAVPLAASLALGIYLGAQGSLDFMLPTAITGGVALNDDSQPDDLGGIGDAEAEESLT